MICNILTYDPDASVYMFYSLIITFSVSVYSMAADSCNDRKLLIYLPLILLLFIASTKHRNWLLLQITYVIFPSFRQGRGD